MRAWLFAVACVVVMAGCAEPPKSPGITETPPTEEPPGTDPAVPLPLDSLSFPGTVHLSQCNGFWTSGTYPVATMPPMQDPYWEPPPPVPVIDVYIEVYDCPRVSIGPFERPLRILTEVSQVANAPEPCQPEVGPGEIIQWRTLTSIWVNDTEVADWIRAVWEMPVYYSPIEDTTTNDPVFLEHTWTWGIDGEKSALTIFDDSPEFTPSVMDDRYFWFNETAVSSLDLHRTFTSPNVHRPMKGTLAKPMLGAYASKDYVDEVMMMQDIEADMEVIRYKDHFCTPVS